MEIKFIFKYTFRVYSEPLVLKNAYILLFNAFKYYKKNSGDAVQTFYLQTESFYSCKYSRGTTGTYSFVTSCEKHKKKKKRKLSCLTVLSVFFSFLLVLLIRSDSRCMGEKSSCCEFYGVIAVAERRIKKKNNFKVFTAS